MAKRHSSKRIPKRRIFKTTKGAHSSHTNTECTHVSLLMQERARVLASLFDTIPYVTDAMGEFTSMYPELKAHVVPVRVRRPDGRGHTLNVRVSGPDSQEFEAAFSYEIQFGEKARARKRRALLDACGLQEKTKNTYTGGQW